MSRRITFEPHGGVVKVIITPRRSWWLMMFGALWLSGAVVGAVWAISELLTGKANRAFLGIWLVLWCYAVVLMGYIWMWSGWGREVLSVSRLALAIRRELLGIGRTREFRLRDFTNLRAAGYFGDPWKYDLQRWGVTGGTVAFDTVSAARHVRCLVDPIER